MPELMRDVLDVRMLMEHRDDGGVVVFTSRAWRRLFDSRVPLVRELILEFLSMLRFEEVLLNLDTPGTIQFQLGLDVGSVNIPCLLARYLRRFAAGRKSEALISGEQFGPKRQPNDAAGALIAAEDAPVVDEDMPQAVPPPPRTQGERIA
ncbi:hypothetical protein Tco_1462431 [Tanacetum coccineum]